jgi:signal transduction histidine kinase
LLTLLVALAVPLGAFTMAVNSHAKRTLEQQAQRQNRTSARLSAQVVMGHLEGLKNYMDSVGRSRSLAAVFEARDGPAIEAELERLVERNPHLDRAFVTDAAGIELYGWPFDADVIGKSFAHRDWYKGVSSGDQTYLSELYHRASLDQSQAVALATPIDSDAGERLGYVVAHHPIDLLTSRLIAIEDEGGVRITLVDHKGLLVVVGADKRSPLTKLSAHPLAQSMLDAHEESMTGADPLTNEICMFSTASVPNFNWVVLAQQPLNRVLEPARMLQNWILGLSALCLIAMLSLGFVWFNVVRRQHVAVVDLQRQKDLLTGMIIHDLRNPLAVTLLSIDELRLRVSAMNGPGAAPDEDVEQAYAATQRTLAMVNLLLDVMRMEDGELRPKRTRNDLAGIVRAKVEEYRAMARVGSIVIEAKTSAAVPSVEIDAKLLARVIDNLIVNAIKHTPRGGKIQVRLEHEAGASHVALSVADTGEGMPPAALPRLFKKYGRVEGQGMGQSHDTGLGLVFCRMAVELHGGTIEAHSELGVGTTIRIELPRPRAH